MRLGHRIHGFVMVKVGEDLGVKSVAEWSLELAAFLVRHLGFGVEGLRSGTRFGSLHKSERS